MFVLRWLVVSLLALLAVWVTYAAIFSPITPAVWVAPENPGLTGVFAPNSRLQAVQQVAVPGLGPEDVACDVEDTRYTGLENGDIVRWQGEGAPTIVANTGGRPLGMKVDSQGRLVVADAMRGLLRISPEGAIEILADTHAGEPMRFVDDLDIAADGTIWFSDASRRFGMHDNLLDFYEGSMTGRLLSWDPATGETTEHLGGLFFGNGVALGPNDDFVLINETGLGRVQRLWLKGPKAGQQDFFVEGLPGTPDNINFDGEGTFWIAMPSLRASADQLAERPFLRKMLAVLPGELMTAAVTPSSFVVGVDLAGNVVQNLYDPELGYHYITSATPCNGALWLGSLAMSAVGRLALD